jgi:ABC-type lipoprotein release transport system permease subunit
VDDVAWGTREAFNASFRIQRLLPTPRPVLQSLLYEVGPRDPGTYVAVALTLGGVAFAACSVPAWRASREDAVVALRAEDG